MRVSLITTCLNEGADIKDFLNSVINQSKKPDEFIIVDAGSTDGTIDIVKKYQEKHRWIRLIVKRNVSRGKGRNIAIKNAKGEIIAVADAGCILQKDWLKNITSPFKEGYDIVIGYYKPFYKNDFQFFCGRLLVPKKLDVIRMSSRSLAFKKAVWKETGGYEENVDVGEDTIFHWKILKKKLKTKFEKSAIVYWIMPRSSKELFKKFFRYGAGYWQTIKLKEFRRFLLLIFSTYFYLLLLVSFLFIVPYLSIFLVLFLFLGLICIGIKGVLATKKLKAFVYMPYLFLLKNLSFVIGFTFGKIKR